MVGTKRRDEPPYRQIARSIRDRICAGELAPGDPVPSTRELTAEWGVAMATATKALATLRQEGWVQTRPGASTRVAADAVHVARPGTMKRQHPPGQSERLRRPGSKTSSATTPLRHSGPTPSALVATEPASSATPAAPASPSTLRSADQLNRARIVAAATQIADREGLNALTIRRLAADLGVGAMSLYRHVPNKDELLTMLCDEVFGHRPLPQPGPTDWRQRLELVCALQWRLYHDHPWLAQLISFTRPLLAPNAMAHTEWTLRSLKGLGLTHVAMAREAITLPAVVRSVALARLAEIEAERETGVTAQDWWAQHSERAEQIQSSGAFPMLEAMPEEVIGDFDAMYDYAVQLHLDGLAARVQVADTHGR